MYIKTLFILLITIFIGRKPAAQQLSAGNQDKHALSGKLTGGKGEAVPFATIALFEGKQTTPVRVVSADSSGAFDLGKWRVNPYTIKVAHLLYADTALTVSREQVQTGQPLLIRLNPIGDTHLKGITVTGKKPVIEWKIDRVVYNIENSVTAIGNDALESLRQLPGVKVQNEEISIVGKGSVNVLMNGRLVQLSGEDLANLLRSIPAERLSKIELISNPPAQYDAAGNAGLINIVTKKKTGQGFDGLLSASYKQVTYGQLNGGGSFNFSDKRWSTRLSFNYTNGSSARNDLYQIYYPSQLWQNENRVKSNFGRFFGEAGIDYNISSRTLVGITYNGSFNDLIMNQDLRNSFDNKAGQQDSLIKTRSRNQQRPQTHTVNLHIESLLDSTGKKITVDADYLTYDKTQQQSLSGVTYSPGGAAEGSNPYALQIASPQQIDVYTLQAGAELPLSFARLSFGGKLSFISNNSASYFYRQKGNAEVYDSTQSNAFRYKENTQALYVDANRTLGKWELKAGLRAEFTQTDGLSETYQSRNRQHYMQLFPTLYVLHHFNTANSLSFSYGRRIDRPAYWRLNPFRWYSNLYNYSEGNPFLQPSYNNNFEMTFNRKGWLVASVYANFTENGFNGLSLPDAQSLKVATVQRNFLSSATYGLSQSVNISGVSWLESNNQLQVYYTQTTSHDVAVQNTSGWGARASSDNSFILNEQKTLIAALNFSYQFPQVLSYMEADAYYSVDAGLKALLHHKRITLALNATDIFKTLKPGFSSTVNGVRQKFSSYDDYRNIRLYMSYKFGNNKSKKRNINTGNKSEQQRIN